MNKTQARQRIRNLKKIIHNSTEKFATAMSHNYYDKADIQLIIISGNVKELNKLRHQIKANKSTISQNKT